MAGKSKGKKEGQSSTTATHGRKATPSSNHPGLTLSTAHVAFPNESAETIATTTTATSAATINTATGSTSSTTASSAGKERDECTSLFVYESVRGGAFRVTWNDIVALTCLVIAVVVLTIMVGLTVGISISVHYFDRQDQEPVFPHLWDAIEAGELLQNLQRVTITDPIIVLWNRPQQRRDRDGLGRVIHKSSSGKLTVMQVVDEFPIYNGTDMGTSGSTTNNGSNSDGGLLGTRSSLVTDMMDEDNDVQPPRLDFRRDLQEQPVLCSDGRTYGYDSWTALQNVLREANTFAASKFAQWNEFYALSKSFTGVFDDDSLYYEEDIYISICPGAVLRARRGPIFVNADNLVVECQGCTIEVGGSHFSFGPHAHNVLFRGITFKRAHMTSLLFYQNGADATFEDCRWINNHSIHNRVGYVADVNSSSTVNFYRCMVGKYPLTKSRSGSSLSIKQG